MLKNLREEDAKRLLLIKGEDIMKSLRDCLHKSGSSIMRRFLDLDHESQNKLLSLADFSKVYGEGGKMETFSSVESALLKSLNNNKWSEQQQLALKQKLSAKIPLTLRKTPRDFQVDHR